MATKCMAQVRFEFEPSGESRDGGYRVPGQAGRDLSARRAHATSAPGRTDSVGGSRLGTTLHV
jgi:hypothetical protein